MASSSSSSHLAHASSSQTWNHDVFMSFRGEDTRKNFVDHLYSALVQQGIYTYKDDETLPRGEIIGPSLLKAIRESRIAVIVFSENYADSSWCLDELAYIMDCMNMRGQIVMPIFYGVDPSDVRKQKGKYGEAFDKHELENNNKVGSWRKALVNAGNLSGWVPKDIANGHEAKCIKDIVGTISNRLFPLISNVNKDLVGIETRLQDLFSQLDIVSGGVRMVGIWGVGGGGKITLASSAYTKISHNFDAHCLLENIRDESRRHGLKKLQEKTLSRILNTKVELDGEDEGRCMIKSRLCYKKVLIVLDDVDDLEKLEALAGSHDWFGGGSRIIITTRDKHLLTRKADAIYGVSLLSHEQAIELFRRHAYQESKPVEDYEKLSLDVVSYAGGLPLALKVLGSFLYDKDKDEWISALAKLRDVPNSKIMHKLTISYDGLQPDEKELFLDIACFLRYCPVDMAMMLLDAVSFHPVIGVKVLVQKSLINVSNGIFDMHDIIEEMAHYIVRREHPKHPEKHSRVWREEYFDDICDVGTTMENDKIEVVAIPESFDDPRLPQVVANMKKLRWIIWGDYPESSLPTNFQPTKLNCLMLPEGSQEQLWQGSKHLPNLKIIDLRRSDIIKTPDLSGVPCLERMILKHCENLKEIHPSIGYLERLIFLDMKGCEELRMFPPIVRMRKLETLKLSLCEKFRKFPEIKTDMNSLVKLRLNCTAIDIVPSSVGKFCTNLVSLDLSKCEKLKRIEGNFRLLKDLKELHLEGCEKLEKLPDEFFDVNCSLEMLSLCTQSQSWTALKNFINCFFQEPVGMKFPQFPHLLTRLSLNTCSLLDGDIPPDMWDLSNLQILDLRENYFTRLHGLSRLSCLKYLNLSNSYGLTELPDLPSSIAVLKATQCNSLESVGDLSNCKLLWKVSLWREDKLIGVEKVLHSMLQGNAVEDHFISVTLPGGPRASFGIAGETTYTLELPQNWCTDFNGFLICADKLQRDPYPIVIKQVDTCIDSQPDHWEEFDKSQESDAYAMGGYVSFGSLTHTSWWNSTYTRLSFSSHAEANIKVGLVPRKNKVSDSNERGKGIVDCSEYWDEEVGDRKTFEILHDSTSSIRISWSHYNWWKDE